MQERHSIKRFRETNLGIIRLEKLADPSKDMKIFIGEKQVWPISFDTYGHPIISESNFAYYLSEKQNTERRGESLVPIVEYENKCFCIIRSAYDSEEAILTAISSENDALKHLKQILIERKQAAFCGKELDTFVLYGKYVLSSNGHTYVLKNSKGIPQQDVAKVNNIEDISYTEEIHIPSENDTCDICGKKFTIEDVQQFSISANESSVKTHKVCLEDFKKATEHQIASQIVDAVYDGRPVSEIKSDYDSEESKFKTWYVYKTNQGTIRICFRTKVIVIEWEDNFKPFNMSIFDNERVTKYDRGIHAWSKDDAIRYLSMAKKA